MNITIITSFVAAIVAAALAFVAGWQTQEWRYGKQITGIQAQHAVERPADPGAGEALLRAGCCGWDQARKGSI